MDRGYVRCVNKDNSSKMHIAPRCGPKQQLKLDETVKMKWIGLLRNGIERTMIGLKVWKEIKQTSSVYFMVYKRELLLHYITDTIQIFMNQLKI